VLAFTAGVWYARRRWGSQAVLLLSNAIVWFVLAMGWP
jgi:hypothetical protein